MKNLSSNKYNYFSKIKIARILILVIFLFSFLSISSAQSSCQKFEEYSKALDEVSEKQIDSLLTELASEGYWEEWYKLIYDYSGIFYHKKQFDKSVEFIAEKGKFTTISDPYIAGKYYYLLAYEYQRVGDIYHALENMKTAHKFFTKTEVHSRILSCLKSLGVFYSRFNDHYQSIEYGYLYLNQLLPSDQVKRATAHSNLADFHFYAGQFEKTLEHLDSALYHSPDFSPYKLLTEIRVELERKNFNKALELIEICKKEFGQTKTILDELKILQAHFYSGVANYHMANDLWKQVIKRSREEDPEREYYKNIQQLAEFYFQSGEYQKALEATHELQKYFAIDFDIPDPYSIPEDLQLIPEAWLMESLFLKARIFKMQWINQSEKDLKILHTYEKAMKVLDLLREQFSALGSIYAISEVDYVIFDDAISFCWQRYDQTNDSIFYHKAFAYSQKAKSYALKQSRTYRSVLEESEIDESLVEKYLHFISISSANLNEKNQNSDSLEYYAQKIEAVNPDFKDLKNNTTVEVEQIQNQIPKNSALLHYFVGDSLVHCFTIYKHTHIWHTHSLPHGLDSIIQTYRTSLNDINYIIANPDKAEREYLNSASLLYRLLVKDQTDILLKNNIKHLMIISDDFIDNVSFDALPMTDDLSWTNPEIYLLNKFQTSQLYLTSEVTKAMFNQPSNVKSSTTFSLDYIDYQDLDAKPFPKLDNAISEGKAIAEIIESNFIANSDVELNNVFHSMKSDEVMHFTGHAVYDPINYTNSYLPIYKDGRPDRLSYSAILRQSNPLKLISLSACNTTNGQKVRTEGLIGLSRAMIESGAESCLGSLWEASDKASKEILIDFYSNLKKGFSKPEALNKAQISYIRNPQLRTIQRIPLYWANWELYGNPAPLSFHNVFSRYSTFGTILLVTILLIFAFLKKSS